jgi:hypothetical protein
MEFQENHRIGSISAHDFMGKNGFFWWIGVVEDRNDPLKIGRAKVRIFGYHTSDQTLLPTEELPWALPVAPLNNPYGVKSPAESSWVLGFFLDGQIAQQPVMLGVLPGVRMRDVIDAKQFNRYPEMDI